MPRPAVTGDPYAAAKASAARLAELTGQPGHDAAVVLGSGWAQAADALGPGPEVALADLGGFPPPTVEGHTPAVRYLVKGNLNAEAARTRSCKIKKFARLHCRAKRLLSWASFPSTNRLRIAGGTTRRGAPAS